VPTNGIADVVAGHDISVHVRLAVLAVEPTYLDLADKLLTHWTLFRGVVFIHADDNVSKRSHLDNPDK